MRLLYRPNFTMDYVKLQTVRMALKHFDGDKQKTADSLKISLKTVYNLLNGADDDVQANEPERNNPKGRKPRVRRKNK